MITTINNKHKKLNVPNLRFKEFEGEWEKCKLGKIATICGGYAFNSKELSSKKGLYQVVKMGNLYQNNLDLSRTPSFINYIDSKPSKVLLHYGDIAITLTGTNNKRDFGYSYMFTTEQNLLLNQRCGLIRTEHNPYFVFNLVKTNSFLNQFFESSTGGTGNQANVSTKSMESFSVYIPKSKEQRKIADLLRLIAERIATQNKIIDKLQSLIKGMEDNLLDNPLWEKTYLRSFMQFFPTNSLSWEQLSYKEGAIRNLHYGLIHGLQTRGINSASLPMIKNEAVPKQYTLCQVGDVAFADASEDTGEIAKSVEFVDTIEGDTICGLHTIHGRDIKNRTVVGFKGFAFNSRYFHNQIKRLAQGTKVFSITANNLSSCYVYLPDFDTQKAIVKLLKAYEEKLLVSKRLLEQYEKQKQYLLRQMFI
ncbi:restriction endonuclease subunit S [Prevotella sp.]